MEVNKGKLRDTSKQLDQLKVENEKQGRVLNELFWNNLHTLMEKCQYFEDMEKLVGNMKKELKVFTDEMAGRISSFDSELNVLDGSTIINELNLSNNDSVKMHNAKFAQLLSSYTKLNNPILLQQVKNELKKYGVFLTEDKEQMVLKKAETYHNILMERACKYSMASCNETPYRERFAALMAICPEDSMIMHGDLVVLELTLFDDLSDGNWSLKIKKTHDFDRYACTRDFSSKIVEVGLPRNFSSAGICHTNTFFYQYFTFQHETRQDRPFCFQIQTILKDMH